MRMQVRQLAVAIFAIIAVVLLLTTHGAVLGFGILIAFLVAAAVFVSARSSEPRINRAERRAARRPSS